MNDSMKKPVKRFIDEGGFIYYLRDGGNAPVITVCLMKDENGYHRGISLCSPADNPDKLVGKYKAIRYLRKTVGSKLDAYAKDVTELAHQRLLVCSTDELYNIIVTDVGFRLGMYNTVLTQDENEMVNSHKPINATT